MTPAAVAGALNFPLPTSSFGGSTYGGRATFPLTFVPLNLRLALTYTNRTPAGMSALSAMRGKPASTQRSALSTLGSDVVYACFAANQAITLNGPPAFTFTLPAGFALGGSSYYLALWQGAQWVPGYSDAGSVSSNAASTTVSIAGRFGFTIRATGQACVALYALSNAASTPVPATPAASPSPSATASPMPTQTPTAAPAPSASPTSSPRSTPAPAPTPTPAPTRTPTPEPTPTATPTSAPTPTPVPTPTPGPPMPSVASLSFTAVGGAHAQIFSVSESNYAGTWTASSDCTGIAAVSTSDDIHFTVTPAAAGTCTVTVHDGNGAQAAVPVSITSTNIGVN